ncbi:MAG: outer membrane lipid asymmetry maintenance protein MlaD [Sphingomonadales bacterium]
MMGGNPVETIIGAIVLSVAVGFLSFAYTRTDIGSVNGYHLVAKFDRIDGLAIGSDVRMSGIKIGTIVDQELDNDTFEAVVKLSIDSAIRLPDDTAAKVTSEGLLGGYYMSIEPGGSEDLLESGDEIEFTQGSVDLMGLVGQAIFSATDSPSKEN